MKLFMMLSLSLFVAAAAHADVGAVSPRAASKALASAKRTVVAQAKLSCKANGLSLSECPRYLAVKTVKIDKAQIQALSSKLSKSAKAATRAFQAA